MREADGYRVWALLLLLLDTLVFQLLFLIAPRLQLTRDLSLLACDTPLVPVSVPGDVPPSYVYLSWRYTALPGTVHKNIYIYKLQFLTASIDKLLAKDVGKGRITQEESDTIRGRLTSVTSMDALNDVDFVIEAVPEIPELKFKIFKQLAQIAPSHAILATNTSSISITRIAAATTENPTDTSASSRVVSTHFMNPVPIQKGVEIISGLQTSEATLQTAIDFCTRMGKISSVSTDSPGFLANRILMPYINEAIICLETGVGRKEDIDGIMKNGTNVPMGPLQLADFIGIDTCLAIMKVLYNDTGDSKYRPSVLLQKMVDAGWHGKKSGKGFYDY